MSNQQNDPDDSGELEALREKIDAADEKIVTQLAERQKLVHRIVEIKKKHHLPVHHPAREEDLISLRRRQGREADLDPDFIEELYRTILRQSRVEQTGQMRKKGIRPEAVVLIVGGYGEMGRYFEACFSGAGYRVRLMGRNDWERVGELCADVELAIVSVPIEKTAQTVHALAPHLPENAVLSDITSIKQAPVEAMTAAHKGPVLGMHPLFGPTTSSLDKQIVVATPGRDSEACQWVLDQFTAWGAVIVTATAEEHDDIMAVVQSLRHFATFAFGQFIERKKVPVARTLEFSSPIYRLELGMVGRLFAQDAAMYAEIIFASDQRRQLLKDYIHNIYENLEMVEKGDKQRFISEFRKIAEWFGPFSEQAIRESSYLIDKLIERF
ncbi:MAG: bifunctional chorismate mutase/prephenate dehydrogenase [Desulfobacteraceae bacterium]|nr:bifunctional chorismate mutase/prephenate dehydrogenase [Desulfobacteraceae bacterium]